MPDLFEVLKQPHRAVPAPRAAAERLYFVLAFDDVGARLEVRDSSGAPVKPSHEYYSGGERDLLKSLHSIEEHGAALLDWSGAGRAVYLKDHEYLLWLLPRCPNVVTEALEPIRFAEGEAGLVLRLEEAPDELYLARVLLRHSGSETDQWRPVTESHVLAGATLYHTAPLGPAFARLPLFACEVRKPDIERYLTLLVSTVENVAIEYQDYRLTQGTPRVADVSVVVERVDELGNLYLRVAETIAGFDPDFIEDYDVLRVVTRNDIERTIAVHDLAHENRHDCFRAVDRLLSARQRQHGQGGYATENNLFIIDRDLAPAFLAYDLGTLLARYPLFGAQHLKAHRVRTPQPRLHARLSFGIDFLEGDAQLEIEGQFFPLAEAMGLLRKNPYIPLNDGTLAVLNPEYIARLHRLFRKSEKGVRLSFFDLPLAEDLLEQTAETQTLLQRAHAVFAGFDALATRAMPTPRLQAPLRGYQEHGFRWLRYLYDHGLGGCLADDMGLGKTLQALAVLTTVYPGETAAALIVMPRSLLFNWAAEIRKFAPHLTFYTYHGDGRDLEAAVRQNLVLTTYATVRLDIERLMTHEFAYVILDEAQHVKTLNSQAAKAVRMLRARRRLALSGTPMENRLTELYSLFRFLNPAMFGSVEDFNAAYTVPIQRDGDPEATRQLRRKLQPFLLRRLKKDVAADLPDKIEQTLYVDMGPAHAALYEARRRFYRDAVAEQIGAHGLARSQFFVLQAMTELRQLASIPEALTDGQVRSPKIEPLCEQLRDAFACGHKVLVFANFLAAVDAVATGIGALGVERVTMTGATQDREAIVRRFQTDPTCRAFVCTLKTGGLGLNLTAADYIFIFDPWWNRAAENQAVDRCHRIGQDKTVFSYRIIVRNTIEEKILQLQERKGALFDSLIVADGATLKQFTEDDVAFALGGDA